MTPARLPDAPWLGSGPAARVLGLLNADGEEARVIGGAVRNALLGLVPVDIDIATTALPDEVIGRAKSAGIKSVPTGVDHGTVTLVIAGLIGFAHFSGAAPNSTYVPAHIENGRLVPGVEK